MAAKKPIFDENGKIINKEELIKAEQSRLARIYSGLDKKRKTLAAPLISSAAFMAVSMMELEKIMNIKGYTEKYQNGANQSGLKKTTESETYNNMAKNHLAYRKQLDEMLKDTDEREKSDELMVFLTGGSKDD